MLASSPVVAAADISFESCGDGDPTCALITVSGEIEPGDYARFVERVKGIRKARVDLVGPGGAEKDGINIGLLIHRNGWSTRVPQHGGCLSACAMIWAAGKTMEQDTFTIIMFHAAYNSDFRVADGTGSAEEGAYLYSLGYNFNYVARVIGSDPLSYHVLLRGADGPPVERDIPAIEFMKSLGADAGPGWVGTYFVGGR